MTVTADDYMNIQFKTAKNSLGTITGIYRPFGTSSMTITIYGSEGVISCVDGNMSWHTNNGRLVEVVAQPSAPAGEWHVSQTVLRHRTAPFDAPSMMSRATNAFAELPDSIWSAGSIEIGRAIHDALRGDERALSRAARFSEGHVIQTLLDAARDSHAKQQWVQV